MFKYEENELSVIKCKDEIWFRGKTIAEMYAIQRKAIREHVDPEDRVRLAELRGVSESRGSKTDPLKYRGSKTEPLTNNEKNTIYINESGLYSLIILRSKLESAQIFKRWVTKEVLPSIRKTGRYSSTLVNDDMNHKYNDSLTFKIENETDLHTKVVLLIKRGIQTVSLLLHSAKTKTAFIKE